ncbi:OmpP1/FadL family transporter [Vaginella massiliensis]|uniref:OmpP1/FadL family transporter n=1 Tax=Vaginella massiliensis TaxID=1816680 RepID=UPI003751D351
MRRLFISLALLGLSSSAFAGGYRVALQGVRQAAMGGVSADVRDASVAFYNPAGLAFVDSKLSIAIGGFGVNSEAKWQDPVTLHSSVTDNKMSTPVYAAVSYKPIDDLAVGLSITTPYGSSLTWPKDWENRANVTEIELKSFYFQPTVAYRFNEWFSVGFGFIYSRGSVNLQRAMNLAGNEIGLEIDSKEASGTGFNLGAYFKPSDKVSVSIAYKSKVDIEVDGGDVTWSNVPSALATNPNFNTNHFNASLPGVSEFTFGLAYRPIEKLLLGADVVVNGWSRYKELDIELYNDQTGYSTNSVAQKRFKDTAIYRVGAEYAFTDMIFGRLGYSYDPSPVTSEYWSSETPSANQHAFSAGVGFKFGSGFYLDLLGQYIRSEERYVHNIESNFQGDFKFKAINFGVGLTYNLK